MRRLIPILAILAWALWFGGLITLFLAVNSVFASFGDRRDAAGVVTTAIFQRFERYQLILAAILLASLIGWRAIARSTASRIAIILVTLATVGAVSSTTFVSPRIDAMRVERRTAEPAFRRLHGLSMLVYVGQTILLAGAGIAMTLAPRQAPAATSSATPGTSTALPRA
jgi:hypothetical protein